MNRSDWLTDELIQEAFDRRAGRFAPGQLRYDILSLTASTAQRAAWRLRLRSALATPGVRPAFLALLVLGALLGAALALALVGGPSEIPRLTQIPRPSEILRPSEIPHTGLLAYSQDGDVYFANADGSGAVRVVHDPGVAFAGPTWSPDGRWLSLEGRGAVFLLDPGTLELRRVAGGEGAIWSSDSRSVALVRRSESGTGVIQIVDIGSGAVREIQPNLERGRSLGVPLAWSPDRKWFLVPVNASEGKRLVRIDGTTGEAVDIAPMYHLSEPGAHWSPDSGRFAYARPDACDNPPCQRAIAVVAADLSGSRVITDPAKLASNPIWSPDGAWIAFSSASTGSPSAQTLSIVRPDGRDLRELVELGGFRAPFAWSADGRALDFSDIDPSTGLGIGLFEVRISDGTRVTITAAPNLNGFDWQATPLGRGPDLPRLPSPATSDLASVAPPQMPPTAPAADPTGSWTGLAVDSNCDAGTLNLRTLAFGLVGPPCPDSNGVVVAAPLGDAYAVPESDGSVSVVRSDGPTTRALGPREAVPSGDFGEVELAWSPDGLWLSVHRCGLDPRIDCLDHDDLVVSIDGRNAQRLPGRPSWSPDGGRLAVQAQNGDLLLGSPDGSHLRSIGAFPMPLSWSPDASQFAFIRDGNAWIANADGSGQRNATNFAHGGAYSATWSPDGRFIAVIQESQLWILAIDGGDLRPLVLGPGRTSFHGLSWSPDSARLAVVVNRVDGPATLIARIDDGTAIVLDSGGTPDVAWSPDGRFIALLERDSAVGQIDIANSDGSGRHKVGTVSDGSSRITWVR